MARCRCGHVTRGRLSIVKNVETSLVAADAKVPNTVKINYYIINYDSDDGPHVRH